MSLACHNQNGPTVGASANANASATHVTDVDDATHVDDARDNVNASANATGLPHATWFQPHGPTWYPNYNRAS